MTQIICNDCGVQFGIPDNLKASLVKCHNTFYCPNGHKLCYPGETNEEKLIKQLRQANDILRGSVDFWQRTCKTAEHRCAYYKGQITKLKGKHGSGKSK